MIRRAMCECRIETSADSADELNGPISDAAHAGRGFGHGRRTISLDPAGDPEAWNKISPASQNTLDVHDYWPPLSHLCSCTAQDTGDAQCSCPDAYPYPYAGELVPERAWATTDPDASRMRHDGGVVSACEDIQASPGQLSHPGCGLVASVCYRPEFWTGKDGDPKDPTGTHQIMGPVVYCADDPATHSLTHWMLHDFCFADFNYCVGLKILNAARSVATPPRTMGIQNQLLEHATMHLTESVGSYASGLQSEPPGFALGWPVLNSRRRLRIPAPSPQTQTPPSSETSCCALRALSRAPSTLWA